MYITKDKLEEIKTFKLLSVVNSSVQSSVKKQSYTWVEKLKTNDTLGGGIFQVTTDQITTTFFIEKDEGLLNRSIELLEKKFGT